MVDSSQHWSRQCSKGTDSLKTTKLKPQYALIIIIICIYYDKHHVLCVEILYTVIREIFKVKKFSWVPLTHEN